MEYNSIMRSILHVQRTNNPLVQLYGFLSYIWETKVQILVQANLNVVGEGGGKGLWLAGFMDE